MISQSVDPGINLWWHSLIYSLTCLVTFIFVTFSIWRGMNFFLPLSFLSHKATLPAKTTEVLKFEHDNWLEKGSDAVGCHHSNWCSLVCIATRVMQQLICKTFTSEQTTQKDVRVILIVKDIWSFFSKFSFKLTDFASVEVDLLILC